MRLHWIIFAVLNVWSSLILAEAPPFEVPDAPAEYLKLKNQYTSAADVKNGKKYYELKCAECHGDSGEGEEDGNAVVFNNSEWMSKRSDGQLFFIASEGAGEDAEMEGYGPYSDEGMSEKRIWQMIAYIKTLSP